MNRTMFYRRTPAARELRMLAIAATAALALSACGGGGGSLGSSSSGPSTLGTGLSPSASPSAGGLQVSVSYSSKPVISIERASVPWNRDPETVLSAPDGWAAETKQNGPQNFANQFFRIVTNIDRDGDDDYLAYGYWSKKPVTSLGRFEFKPFYYGTMPYEGDVREQTGSATYSGGATGVYQLNPASGSTSADGRFTADVTIAVSFGSNTEAAALQFGMSNIETLTSDEETGPTVSDTSSGALTAEAAGSSFTGTAGGARWGGHFYGPSSGVPTGIAGWLEKVRAQVTGGNTGDFVALSGSFGAEKQ